MRRFFLLWCVIGLMIFAPAALAQTDDVTQQDFIVEAEVDNSTPFVGEEIWYVFRYYAYLRPAGLDERLPDFTGFWLGDSYDVKENRVEVRDGRQYLVGEIWVNIVPLYTGEIVIEASELHVPETIFRDGFDVLSNTVTMMVRALPEPMDAPANGVGQFDIEASLDHDTAIVGEPIELRVSVTGQGNLEQMEAPPLGLPNTWRVYFNRSWILDNGSVAAGIRQRQKIFTWTVIPDRAGTHIISPIGLTYFDPLLEQYQTVESDLLEVAVVPGEDGVRVLPTLDISRSQSNIAIAPYPVPRTLTRSNGDAGLLWALWLLGPGLALVLTGWAGSKVYYPRYRMRQRQKQAANRAVAALKTLMRREDQPFAYDAVLGALERYVCDRRGIDVKGMDTAALERIFHDEAGLSVELARDFVQRWGQMRQVLYVPEGMRTPPQDFIQEAMQWVQDVDYAWA